MFMKPRTEYDWEGVEVVHIPVFPFRVEYDLAIDDINYKESRKPMNRVKGLIKEYGTSGGFWLSVLAIATIAFLIYIAVDEQMVRNHNIEIRAKNAIKAAEAGRENRVKAFHIWKKYNNSVLTEDEFNTLMDTGNFNIILRSGSGGENTIVRP